MKANSHWTAQEKDQIRNRRRRLGASEKDIDRGLDAPIIRARQRAPKKPKTTRKEKP